MGKGKKTTVGYRYYFGLHMGMCRGPVDEIVEIKVADRTAWRGSITGNTRIFMNEPYLFGGDEKEGGIVGDLEVMMGASDQAVNPELATMLGGLVPAFRGFCSLFYDGLVTSMTQYPKPWTVRLRRALKGWDGEPWYPSRAVISMSKGTIRAMNPAHILYECMTNRDWARGLERARLDDASFKTAADCLYKEGFGLCIKWTRQDTLSNFTQIIINHIGGNLYTDRTTGLIKLTLIRDDYDPLTLPLFDYDSGLLSIDDDDSGAQTAGTNEVIVKFTHPVDNSAGQVRVKNNAAIQSVGGTASATKEYPGIPTAELALRVAQRDLRAASGFIKKFRVRLDRRGYQIAPGSVFRIRDVARGLENIILRAGRVEDGTLTDPAITITAVQDVFGLPATSYVDVQPSGWSAPDTSAKAIVTRRLIEMPYRELAAALDPANLASIDASAGYLAAFAQRPSSLSLGFLLRDRIGRSGKFIDRGNGDFCPVAKVVTVLDRSITSISLTGAVDLNRVEVGTAAMIDDEIVRIDAIDPRTGMATIARGCLDTVPATHAAGALIWFYDNAAGTDQTEYATGMTIQARLLTRTSSAVLQEALAGTDSLTLVQRQYRPYPPGNLLVNGLRFPSSVAGVLTVSFSFRDRLLQADQIIDTLQGNIGPETGTTYILKLYSGTRLRRTVTGLMTTRWTYQLADVAVDGYLQNIRLVLSASRDGIASLQQHDVTIERHGLGLDLGDLLGGSTR
ncbi:hypothetical protein HAV38_03770 [Glaciimonas immobilis]|nr:phage tail protein [Glaciimonas immobilis]KAF3999575.1 hypothetical protein HAV38_03770 [Glaciimonas immobilis]